MATDQPSIAATDADVPETLIQPPRGFIPIQTRELWEYRELLYFLAWRDVSVLYKQTALGIAWALIQPLFFMVVFSLLFGRVAKLPSDNLPYPLFSFAALLPWQYFSSALTASSGSLVASQALLTKVYFPRLIIPVASVLPPLVDLSISFGMMLVLMLYYGVAPTANILFLPVFLLLALLTSLGTGLWLSALNIQYRDVRFAVPFLVQFWLWASPVAYSTGIVPERWRFWYGLNPMAGVIEGFRWALLGTHGLSWPRLAISIAGALVLLVSGAFYFQRMEKTFADVV